MGHLGQNDGVLPLRHGAGGFIQNAVMGLRIAPLHGVKGTLGQFDFYIEVGIDFCPAGIYNCTYAFQRGFKGHHRADFPIICRRLFKNALKGIEIDDFAVFNKSLSQLEII